MTKQPDTGQIGYKNPPRATRFKKGQSGNPHGRARTAKNFGSTLQRELKRRISITENGKRKLISKEEAIAKQMVNKAALGDARAIPLVIKESRPQDAADINQPNDFAEADLVVIAGFLERFRAWLANADGATTPALAATAKELEHHDSNGTGIPRNSEK